MPNPYNYKLLREKMVEHDRTCARVGCIIAHTGYSETYVHKILTGEKYGEEAVFAIADYLGVSRKALVAKPKRRQR